MTKVKILQPPRHTTCWRRKLKSLKSWNKCHCLFNRLETTLWYHSNTIKRCLTPLFLFNSLIS